MLKIKPNYKGDIDLAAEESSATDIILPLWKEKPKRPEWSWKFVHGGSTFDKLPFSKQISEQLVDS